MTKTQEIPLQLEEMLNELFKNVVEAQRDGIRRALENRDKNTPGTPVALPLPIIQPDAADTKTMIKVGNEHFGKMGEEEGWDVDVLITNNTVYWYFDSVAPEGAQSIYAASESEEEDA